MSELKVSVALPATGVRWEVHWTDGFGKRLQSGFDEKAILRNMTAVRADPDCLILMDQPDFYFFRLYDGTLVAYIKERRGA